MTKAIARDPIYRRRRFEAELIELCVRWYITYRLSYRDLVQWSPNVESSSRIPRSCGPAVRAGIREAMGSICAAGEPVLAGGRDFHSRARAMALSVSGGRQTRQVRGVSTLCRSRHGGRAGGL